MPRGVVVEKIRPVWVGENPRGPSAAPQDDTPFEEGGQGKARQKAKGKRQEQVQKQVQMRGFFTAFRMTALGGG
jgi:hypothetical protein